MADMILKGKNTVIAHLKHLKDHNETGFLKEGIEYLLENRKMADFNIDEVLEAVNGHATTGQAPKVQASDSHRAHGHGHAHSHSPHAGGCPGSQAMTIERDQGVLAGSMEASNAPSELRQWPVQMHLINPSAGYFQNSDLLIAADCVAFAAGNFHGRYLKGKTVAIACPKLDSNTEVYVRKITSLIDEARVNTITVMMMEVPCCGGLLRLVKAACEQAARKVPVKMLIAGINGDVIKEEWV
jgi:hypothetical protein